jgi:hypothetical protein
MGMPLSVPLRCPLRTLAVAVLCAPLLAPAGRAAQPAPASASASTPAPEAAADAPLYQVEMVVFRVNAVGSEEDWSSVPPGRGFGAPMGTNAPAPQLVRTLSASDYRLDGVVRGLRNSAAWRPVAHVAWVQTAPPWGSHTGIALAQLGVDAPGLTGTVYLERAPRYLHLGFDVTLDAGAPFHIDEMRNIRPNEKQYFDHPGFGIIAAVYPIKRATP